MKTLYYVAAAAAGLYLVKRRRQQSGPPAARVGELAEVPILDGSNWTGFNVWERLAGHDLKDSAAPNLTGSGPADPGTMGQRQLRLMPAWDGSL